MSEFKNVTVTKEANVYFQGRVTSRKITFESGEVKTLGIMLEGEYEFGTNEAEIMEIMQGELDLLLPNEQEWKKIVAPATFNVAANAKFKLKVNKLVDYCCSYIK